MSRLLARSVDKAHVKGAIKYLKRKGEHEVFINNRLIDLVRYIRRIEQDIEAEESRHIAGRRPQDRRIQFVKLAAQLEGIADELGVFLAPKTRYLQDQEFPPTQPIGLRELRRTISNHFTEPLSAEFVGGFSFRPLVWNRTDVSLGPINTHNRALAIEANAEEIFVELLHRSAAALREAEQKLAKNTPKGGPRESKIRDIMLVNVVAIWHEIDGQGKPASYNRGRTKFFGFCLQLCKALGAGNSCTEAHLRDSVKKYNDLIYQKPSC